MTMGAITAGAASRSFQGRGGASEHYLVIEAPGQHSFERQLALLEGRYAEACAALGLEPETAVFRRLFLSDVVNQAHAVRASALGGGNPRNPVAVSVVQQPPLHGGKVAMLAYHLGGATPPAKRRLSPHHLLVERGEQRHLWSTGLCCGSGGPAGVSAAAQTEGVFGQLTAALAAEGGGLAASCVRTWIFLKDVDVFYHGMVDSRAALFAREGLTRDTHYLASTGIEGACAHQFDVVAMDAYSVLGLRPDQVTHLRDLDAMCNTADYNVTFERGTRIGFADRDHLWVSGTASIDNRGRVVHPGAVLAQLERALANAEAVLRAGGGGLGDLTHLLVYLRDPGDRERVEDALRERFPSLPTLLVQAPVCRPEWLVEVEGMAITAADAPGLPQF